MQEYTAEKQRTSQEKDLLLHEVEEYRLKARKLSEELSALKQNHLQTIHEVSLQSHPTTLNEMFENI